MKIIWAMRTHIECKIGKEIIYKLLLALTTDTVLSDLHKFFNTKAFSCKLVSGLYKLFMLPH